MSGEVKQVAKRRGGWRGWWAALDDFVNVWMYRMLFILIHVLLVAGGCYLLVSFLARGRCHVQVEKTPARMVGVVLGTSPKVGIRDNLYFTTRIDAAAKLFHGGRVHFLVVSGDNARAGYNEPAEMKKALVAKGVPAERVYCDYAGFRTLDSVVRAKKVFGAEEFTVISQRFHNQRAVYLARRLGMRDVIAFDAAMPRVKGRWKLLMREVGARVMALLDVEVFKTEPRFLGPEVRISEKSPPVDAEG